MYRCKDCKALYKEKLDYCDCGNNVFEEILDTPAESVKSEKSVSNTLDVPKSAPFSFLSMSFFAACVIFSLCFIFFLGPKPEKRVHKKTPQSQAQVQQIPKIDAIWDNTPAYRAKLASEDDFNSYKSSLRDLLLSKVDTRELEGSGSCDIEFVLDSHGALRRKKLYSNTANKRLIDAAKGMLANVDKYNPPPKSYAGTPLKLEFSAQNGTYILKYKN